MPDLDFSCTVNLPDITREKILELCLQRPFKKFISFPIDINIACKTIREEVIIDIELIKEEYYDSRI